MMNNETILIDIGPLSCSCTDHLMEEMHKALSEDDDGLFRPHESIYVRQLIEEITGHGANALSGLSTDLTGWLSKRAAGLSIAVPAPEAFVAWSPFKAEAVFKYLAGKAMETWAASDYVLLVDYLVHAYFPTTFPEQVAELAVKQAAVMGKVQAVSESLTAAQAGALLAHFSQGFTGIALDLAHINYSVIDYGMANCCEHVTGFSDSVKYRLKRTILEHEKSVRLEGKQPPHALQTKMFDQFGELNRDWRRLALTEAGEMANQGFVASMPVGKKLKRLEQYVGACPFCKKIDGRIVTIVEPDKKDKNWDTEIWQGKDNVGRSASPYKRVGGQLIKRTKSEMWALPAGLAHPHCRGLWIPVSGPASDDEFTMWLSDHFHPKAAEAIPKEKIEARNE
ncbi:hypothetical protein [Propionivibrio sp.]|uniref:hypothetical protein n=1 Tax=Propionivibrio sp. TaxID=2212460 RepID=UPI003BF3CEE2